MSDGALRIPITGDASQFKATLSEVESSLKYFKEKLKSAKGDQIGKINFTISGLEETKNALTTFGKFADGTLGQLYQKLEQLKTLRLTIQADATALTPVNNAIDETTKKIKDLLSAGLQKPIVEAAQVSANSIQGLKNRIDELNQKKLNLDAKDDYLQIVKLNQQIDRLKTQINNLNKLGLKVDQTIDPAVNSFKNLTNTSNKSRQALTSLSLVAQDLPFGFIAIQNNLPAVLSSFGALNASSNGIKGTLASLGQGLVGPAGLFLAFSVVTGAVTYAIQKYGSLSNAMKVLFSENSALTKAQLDFNKEINSSSAELVVEDSKIRTLTKSLLDSKTPRKEQISYYEELKRISPDIVSGIDKENLGTDEANRLLSQNILLRAELVKLEIQEGGIKAVAAKNAEALAIARDEEAIAQKNLANATAEYNLVSKNSGQNPLAARGAASLAAAASGSLDAARVKIADLTKVQDRYLGQLDPITLRVAQINGKFKEQSDYLEELRKKQKELSKGNNKTFTPTIDSQALDEAFNLDKIISNLTKYGNALIDVNNTEKERKNALKELMEINPEYFKGFDLNKKRVDELKTSIESLIRSFLIEKKSREDAISASKINTELRKAEEKGVKSLGDKYNYFADSVNSIPTDIDTAIKLSEQFDEIGNNTRKATDANNKFIESLKLSQDVIEILKKGLNLKETYNKALEDLLNFSEYSRKEIEKISKDLRFLQEPLEGLFTTLLDEGKVSWKAFADDVIKQIKRIAAALLSKAIIQGIANILAPGAGAIVSRGLKAIDTAALGDYSNGNDWVDLFTGGNGRANFGGVRGNNAMNMAGQVNMVIRGNDLVGVMNRTNTTINRVG